MDALEMLDDFDKTPPTGLSRLGGRRKPQNTTNNNIGSIGEEKKDNPFKNLLNQSLNKSVEKDKEPEKEKEKPSFLNFGNEPSNKVTGSRRRPTTNIERDSKTQEQKYDEIVLSNKEKDINNSKREEEEEIFAPPLISKKPVDFNKNLQSKLSFGHGGQENDQYNYNNQNEKLNQIKNTPSYYERPQSRERDVSNDIRLNSYGNNDYKINNVETFRNNSNNFRHEKMPSQTYSNYERKNSHSSNNIGGDIELKLRLENDNLKTQIESLNRILEQEKRRENMNMEFDNEKLKKMQHDNELTILDIKKKHKQEISELEEKYKHFISNLNDEKRKMKMDFENEMMNEKEKLKNIHSFERNQLEDQHKKSIEDTKKNYEGRIDYLNQKLQQQTELNKLASKVEYSSKMVEDIVNKFQNDKEHILQSEKYMIDNKEKYLIEHEERLRKTEEQLILERDSILKTRKDLELADYEKRNELKEERQRLDKEIHRLTEIQNSLKELEYNAKEKYEKEKLDLVRKSNEKNSELEMYKSEYKNKLTEIEYERRMIQDEKMFFEKYKDEANK